MERSLAYLRSLPETEDVKDVSTDDHHRTLGIDLLWFRRNGSVVTIDSKGDEQAHLTKRYAVEFLSLLEDGVAGNFVTSMADQWHYHVLGNGEIHIWDLQAVKAWFHSKPRYLRTFWTPNRIHKDYRTWGLLLEIKDLLVEAPELVQIIDLHKRGLLSPDPPSS